MSFDRKIKSKIAKLSPWIIKLRKLKMLINRRILVTLLGTFFLLLSVAGIYISNNGYEVKIDGYSVGYVKDEEVVNYIVNKLLQGESGIYNLDLIFNQDIVYRKIKVKPQEITPEDLLQENIASKLDLKTKASIISVDGSDIVTLKDTITAQELLEKVKDNYINSIRDSTVESIKFVEDVKVKEELVSSELVENFEEAYKLLIDGADKLSTHKVEEGENLWVIAEKYNKDVDNLIRANPGINAEKLQIGQEINLNLQKPYVTVETIEKVSYREEVPYDIKTEYSDELYKGQASIKVKGMPGSRDVVGEIVKHNGIEVSRTIIEENNIKEPATQVVLQGTKIPPSSQVAGISGILSRGTLTSTFGYRWGTEHKGIDLAAPSGSPVYAWDGGTVTFSGIKGDYGNLIIIDHGNGYVTYYGHNSKNLVKEGDKVSKGQTIALVGSTGDSTGPHVHFEVRKNGVPVNPLD